jgi:membrane protein YqaA with SNARE-associated domain
MKRLLPLGNKRIAILWGFSEATFFFIVPDIYLSYSAMNGYKKTLVLCIYTVVAAISGGTIMYFLGMFFPEKTFLFLDYIPAISQNTIHTAGNFLQDGVLSGMMHGAITGIPYKIFAAYAGEMRVSLPLFIACSFITRSLRFAIVISISALVYNMAMKNLNIKTKQFINTLFWCCFYIWYFSIMGR